MLCSVGVWYTVSSDENHATFFFILNIVDIQA